MKTHGICHAQSARKHRRQGHAVNRLQDGRYQWLSCSAPGGMYLQMFGRARRPAKPMPDVVGFSGKNPTHIIIDELWVTAKIPETRAVHPNDGKVAMLSVGDKFWPKRRNQHSKPYRVVGFRDGGSVIFARGDEVVSGTMDADVFLTVIGKRVDA